MNQEEQYYLDVLKNISENGIPSSDRTGVGTKFLVAQKFDFDISNGKIPIWTTRKVPWKNQVGELIWFIRGDNKIKWLQDRGINIWNFWADEQGTIGPTYSKQLRNWESPKSEKELELEIEKAYKNQIYDFSWEGSNFEFRFINRNKKVDQLENLIEGLKTNPDSRRHIISLWNAGEYANLPKTYLPSCHSNIIQIVVEDKKWMHYVMYQRSADLVLGFCPWQHALFANMIGRLTNLEPKKLSIVTGNTHIYLNQLDGVREQITRVPSEFPILKINKEIKIISDIENSNIEDYELVDYYPQKFIRFPIAV